MTDTAEVELRSGRVQGPGGRCPSAAVPGRARCAHHIALDKAVREKKRLKQPERREPERREKSGPGAADSNKASLSFGYEEYEDEVVVLRGVVLGAGAAVVAAVAAAAVAAAVAAAAAESRARPPLHGVVLMLRGEGGVLHTPDNNDSSLSFGYEEYDDELGVLRGVVMKARAVAAAERSSRNFGYEEYDDEVGVLRGDVMGAGAAGAAAAAAESPALSHLHGVLLSHRGSPGVVPTSDSTPRTSGSLSFGYEEYEDEVGVLRGVVMGAGAAAAAAAADGSSLPSSAECPFWWLR